MVIATEPGHFEAFRAGTRKALEHYWFLEGQKVFQLLERKTDDPEAAKELAFRVFSLSYENRKKFTSEAQLCYCFQQLAQRLAQAHLWEKGKIKKVEIDVLFRLGQDCSAFDDMDQRKFAVWDQLRRSFRKLTARKRRVLVYYFFRKMSTLEVARRLGVVPQTALNHKSQALQTLKNDFRGNWGENNPFLA